MLDQFFSSLSFVDIFNFCVFLVFSVCYVYQIFYVFVTLTKKPPQLTAKKNHRYAVIVAARNENAVIGDLIHSIRVQNYPQELIDIFVVADNGTDNTAAVAQEAGAIVFPRFNKEHIGKGYALDYGFSCIRQHYSENEYEAYFVFDADNVLDVNYFREMNKTFDNGAVASTSYRNSKNYGFQLDYRGLCRMVHARGEIPFSSSSYLGNQLRCFGHGILYQREDHR